MQKDKSLISRAIREQVEQSPLQLPSNFAYTMEQRIREKQRRREHWRQIGAIASLVVFSVASLVTVGWLAGARLIQIFTAAFSVEGSGTSVFATLLCLTCFAVLNAILLRQYRRL